MATVKSDIEIAREAKMKPIMQIGKTLGIPEEELIPYGHTKAKVSLSYIDSLKSKPDGKLILVTAINPTPAGEGKTTTTVGLGDGLDERLHGGSVGDVAGAHFAGSTRGLDRRVDGREALGGARHEDDVTAVLGETFCDGPADTAASSGDDGDALVDD